MGKSLGAFLHPRLPLMLGLATWRCRSLASTMMLEIGETSKLGASVWYREWIEPAVEVEEGGVRGKSLILPLTRVSAPLATRHLSR